MGAIPDIGRLLETTAAQAMAAALVQFIWQGALIGALTAVILVALRRSAPDVRYVVSTIGLALLLTVPVVTAFQEFQSLQAAATRRAAMPAAGGFGAGEIGASAVAPGSDPGASASQGVWDRVAAGLTRAVDPGPAAIAAPLSPYAGGTTAASQNVLILWSVGVLVLTLRIAAGWLWVRRLRTRAAPARLELTHAAARLARQLHVARPVRLLESFLVEVPTVVGWLKPVVLFPAGALAGLSPLQLEAILAHELAHVRRHDYLINLAQTVVETLLFYHPAVWWVSRQIRIEREHCCDDLAVSLCGDPVLYAQALADLEELRAPGGRLAIAATGGSLLNRVRRLIGPSRTGPAGGPLAAAAALAIIVVVAGIAGRAAQEGGSTRHRSVAPAAADRAPARAAEGIDALHEGAEHLRQGLQHLREGMARLSEGLLRLAPTDGDGFDQSPPVPPAPPAPPAPAPDVLDEHPAAPPAPVPPPPSEPADAVLAPLPPAPPVPAPPNALAPAPPQPPPVPPPARDGVRQRGGQRSGNVIWSNDGEKLELQYRGELEFSDDDTDVTRIDQGGYLRLRDGERAVELRADDSGMIVRTFRVGRSERPFEPEGRAWLARVLPRFIRQTGIGAASRVARIYKARGAPGVLAEISLIEGSFGKRIYFAELFGMPGLEARTVEAALAQAGREIDSDFELASLLISSERLALNDATRKAWLQAARTIGSDFEMRRVLSAPLERGHVPAPLLTMLLDTASAIESDFELASLLLAVGGTQTLDAAAERSFFRALESVGSDFEQRRVLSELLRRSGIAARTVEAALESAAGLESDFEAASLLAQVGAAQPIEGSLRASFFRAVASIGSAFERGRVLQVVAKRADASEATLLEVISLTEGMGNFEAAQVLMAVAAGRPLGQQARAAYIDAAGKLGQFERGRVLSALVGSERR